MSADRKRKLHEAAIECIIIDSRSWNDFKKPGMQRFLDLAMPAYNGPSTRTVQRHLANLYTKQKEDLKAGLSKVSSVSVTADLWKSQNSRHFLCITMHFIDNDFMSNSKVLSFKKFVGRHCAKNIQEHMERIINKFGIFGKIVTTTTDNGSNICLATAEAHVFGI